MISQSTGVMDFQTIPVPKQDPMMLLIERINRDPSESKIDLAPGAYRDDQAKPWILPTVHAAEQSLLQDRSRTHEYLGLAGVPGFAEAAAAICIGHSYRCETTASLQTVAGTGACHLGAAFLAAFYAFPLSNKRIHVGSPSWSNYKALFAQAGLETIFFPHLTESGAFNLESYLGTLASIPQGSVVLLQPCGHNPTGMDPSPDEWRQIAQSFRSRGHFAFFDSAYLGMATGSLAEDRFAIELFLGGPKPIPSLVAQSFSKNMGLYGERLGALHIPTASSSASAAVFAQLSNMARAEYSTSPRYGAEIATRIMQSTEMTQSWQNDLVQMTDRLRLMRRLLYERLVELGTPLPWNQLVQGSGMFALTCLSPKACDRLCEIDGIYMPGSGRIAFCGLTTNNVDRVAAAIDRVVRSVE